MSAWINGIPISITLRADSEDIRAYITRQLELDQYKEECMNDILRNEILEKIIASCQLHSLSYL